MSNTNDAVLDWKLPPAQGYPGYQPKQPAVGQTRGIYDPKGPDDRSVPAGSGLEPPTPKHDPNIEYSPSIRDAPESNEPYIPSRNDRPHDQWGTPDFALQGAMGYPGIAPGPYMPQARDLAPLLHGIVMGIGRWGSHYSGMPAIAMGSYASAYWAAYQKGMHERANQSWTQYQHAQQMFLDRQGEELRAAKDAYALYQDDPEKFHQAMTQIATKYQDQPMLNAIHSGNYAAIDRILGERDKSWNDAAKIKQQQENQKQIQILRELEIEKRKLEIEKLKKGEGDQIPQDWRDTPDGGTSGAATPDTTPPDTAPDTAPAKPDATPPNAAPSDEPVPPAAPRRPTPTTTGQAPSAPPGPSGATVPPSPAAGLNPRIKAAADDEVRGIKAPEGVPKAVLPKIAAEAERQKAALNDLMNNGGITGDNEAGDLAAIRKINPNLARDVEAMGHYKRVLPAGGERMYANMENLVRSVYKHWDPSVYKFIDEFSNPNSKESQTLQRAGTLRGAAEGVFRGLKDIDENAKPPSNWIDAATGAVTGSGKWPYLGQAVYDYIVESLTIQNGGTRPLAGQIKAEMDRFAITRGAKSIRALMASTALATVHRVDEAEFVWKSRTHLDPSVDPPPGLDDKAVGWLRAIANMDYNTGYPLDKRVPVPDDMRPYLGPAGTNLHKGQTAHTSEEIEGAKKWLADPKNASDPRRARIEEMIRGQ